MSAPDDLTTKQAMAELQAVAEKVWTQFDSEMSPEKKQEILQTCVADFLKGMQDQFKNYPETTIEIDPEKTIPEQGILGVAIKTTNPEVAKVLRRMNDKEYMDLIDKIQKHATDMRAQGREHESYVLNADEEIIVRRHMDPPVTITLTIKKDTNENNG